ncbi:restriction endonuclease subunit S [Gillisia marina]|uniref:restriction endonuclease subunit S n=1 Tax=Gillisia marina TaxID=1167637 RepID=UPI00029B4C31|nr:restriction endonuclease subunit S [Gillisia marina]
MEIFGDPIRNEKEFEMLSGGEYLQKLSVGVVIKPASHYVKDGVLALRSLNIKPNRIDLTDVVYFSEESNQKLLAKSILKEGDVVFVRTGNTGTAAIIPKELEGSNCIDLIISRPNHEIMNPQYLVYFFNSEIGKRIVTSKEVGGIHKHFNVGALKKLRIPIPPLPLQNEFARILAHTESVKYNLEFSLREITNLYDSLSQKAFKGELDLSKVNISQFEEESNSGKTLGKKGFKPTYVSLTIEKLEQIIKSQFGYQEFTIAQIEDILNKKEIDFNNSMVKGIVKNLLSEEKIRTEYSGLTQQVIFKYNK